MEVAGKESNGLPLTIRAATESDVPVVLDLIRGLADYVDMSAHVVTDEPTLRASLFGENPSAEVALACVGKEAVGFAVFFENFSTFLGRKGLYLEDLFVRPQHRKRGYGRALLHHLAREANRRGCGRFEWMVLEWNHAAISFYETMGAEILKEPRICRLTGEALRSLESSD